MNNNNFDLTGWVTAGLLSIALSRLAFIWVPIVIYLLITGEWKH